MTMGFDVTYHPATPDMVEERYLEPRMLVMNGMHGEVENEAMVGGIKTTLMDDYIRLLEASLEFSGDDVLERTHGFAAAACLGFFGTYFYIRGGAVSFVLEEHPCYARFTSPLGSLFPAFSGMESTGGIRENYSAGVYTPPESVGALRDLISGDPTARADFEEFLPGPHLEILLRALDFAIESGTGLLEATDVIIPNPADPYSSDGYTDLSRCDPDGMALYVDTVMRQLREATDG